ncbi:SirB1 family protein [Candidatus Poriferisodalis sp.]|uniref:SirB1 family protein n=1 Tax=Candidatus Poriferisodalis sp. TaxID=3101277 RepID=UPI003B02441A
MSDADAGAQQPSEADLSPADAFAMWAACEPVPLDRAALAMATHCRADCRAEPVDVASTLAELDRLGAAVREPTPEAVVELLFGAEGFGPNRARYADPANSYLDLVVARRLGIPISLAVVTIEVARRAGVELHGVGMPGHFLVGTPDPQVLIDAFDGRFIDRTGAIAIFNRTGQRHAFHEVFFKPASPQSILVRMLNNLRTVHLRQPGAPSQLTVLELLTRLDICPPDEHLYRAQLLAAVGRPDEGARALEAAADRFEDKHSERFRQVAMRLWAQLN